MELRVYVIFVLGLFTSAEATAARLFIPMDARQQTNHLKAYGIAFAALKNNKPVYWLLNYKGGSFVMDDTPEL